ncbi:S8 family serine peptidase [Streptomyces sp. NPDC059631]|uniref:S8 family serine peptidase n=1 Tax=unclassified Streptomyces TaxID=2593676 RepID=UPI0036887609
MNDESTSFRPARGRVRRRGLRSAVAMPLLGSLAAFATAVPAAVPAAAAVPNAGVLNAGAPVAGSSADPPKLPLMPPALTSDTAACTKPSKVRVDAVPWAQQSLNLARAGRYSQGAGVPVGVVDTGVSPQAPLLAGRVQASGSAAQDCVGHGTFLAGLVAAAPAPGGGFSGVAPGARIIGARGTDKNGTASAARVAEGIEAVVAAGAKIVVVSAALPAPSTALTSAVTAAQAHDVLVIAPAAPDTKPSGSGQGESAAPTAYWPAAADGVLSVVDTAIDGGRPQDAVPVPGHADLAAPGTGITGIGPTGPGVYVANGPSVAAAFVAGTAALVRAQRPGLSARETADRLRASAAHAEVPLLDPAAALSMVLPSAAPAAGQDDTAVRLPGPAARSDVVRRAGLLAGAALLVALGAAAVAALARTRRTRRPAGSGPA